MILRDAIIAAAHQTHLHICLRAIHSEQAQDENRRNNQEPVEWEPLKSQEYLCDSKDGMMKRVRVCEKTQWAFML